MAQNTISWGWWRQVNTPIAQFSLKAVGSFLDGFCIPPRYSLPQAVQVLRRLLTEDLYDLIEELFIATHSLQDLSCLPTRCSVQRGILLGYFVGYSTPGVTATFERAGDRFFQFFADNRLGDVTVHPTRKTALRS